MDQPLLTLGKSRYLPNRELPLSLIRRSPQPPFDRHRHEFDELVVILSGAAIHRINDASFRVRVGDVFVIHEGEEHEFTDLEALHLVNVLFSPALLPPLAAVGNEVPGLRALFLLEPEWRLSRGMPGQLHLEHDELAVLESLLGRLETELSLRPPGYGVMAQALFLEIVLFLSRTYTRAPRGVALGVVGLSRALSYLERNGLEPVALETLAREARMSVRTFQRTFTDLVGVGPRAFQRDRRLRRARELLGTTSQSITEVAFASGFNDSNYFCRAFRQAYGTSPQRWRQADGARGGRPISSE